MKEITLSTKDMLNIINEEVARFQEKIEHDSIVNGFANTFALVFAEALGKSKEDDVYKNMFTYIKNFRKAIIESTRDPSWLSKRDQFVITTNNQDREITKLISPLQESKKDNTRKIILEGDLFYGKESTDIKSAEYKNREVFLNTIYLGSTKKYKMYVENAGKVECIEFGEKNFDIRKTDPTAKYPKIWVCKDWTLNEYIVHSGDEWIVKSETGDILGKHKSKEDAEAQLQAIHISKAKEDIKEGVWDKTKKFAKAAAVAGAMAGGSAGMIKQGVDRVQQADDARRPTLEMQKYIYQIKQANGSLEKEIEQMFPNSFNSNVLRALIRYRDLDLNSTIGVEQAHHYLKSIYDVHTNSYSDSLKKLLPYKDAIMSLHKKYEKFRPFLYGYLTTTEFNNINIYHQLQKEYNTLSPIEYVKKREVEFTKWANAYPDTNLTWDKIDPARQKDIQQFNKKVQGGTKD